MPERKYMERAIELAKKARGFTNPNPLVGAVIVKNGRIIGEGYHRCFGQLHAERNAIASLKEDAKGADIYVTLEPCCHYGKTPPCTEAIIRQGIGRVIIGSRDPNPKVCGKGAEILREAGIEVIEDFMKEECDELNPVFFHYITTGLPYVTMKYAMTADGKIATRTGKSQWISNEKSRDYVHRMRHESMAIMAGIGTVLADDPMLNVRIEGLKSPIRIVCDSHLRIPVDCRICKTAKEYRSIIVCTEENEKAEKLREMGLEVLKVREKEGEIDLRELMEKLGAMGIDSILLEGGAVLNDSALRAGIVQQLFVFIGPKIFGGKEARSPVEGKGIELVDEAVELELKDVQRLGGDIMLRYSVGGGR